MFTAEELASMRATMGETLDDSCVRRRYPDSSVDDYGNVTRGIPADVPYACSKKPAPGAEDTTDRDVQTNEASFLLPHDADVAGGDELVHDGTTWHVIGPAVTQSWATHLRVFVRRTEAL